jgi:DNA adenine methylase
MELQTIAPVPFLKWAGGKHRLLAQYMPHFPRTGARYMEPFVGSAAAFFHVRGQNWYSQYVLSDSNVELMNCYSVVRDDLESLIALLVIHREQHSLLYYGAVRDMDRKGLESYSPVERAARFIYLNKTCYNGLWRVNQRGYFNVPMGRYKNPAILDTGKLRTAAAALQGVELVVGDFLSLEVRTLPEDIIYFDPPYDPLSKTANFTAYAAAAFGEAQQRALAAYYRRLHARGCTLILSNSDTPLIRELYRDFRIESITARRAINSKADRRGTVNEVLVLNT